MLLKRIENWNWIRKYRLSFIISARNLLRQPEFLALDSRAQKLLSHGCCYIEEVARHNTDSPVSKSMI